MRKLQFQDKRFYGQLKQNLVNGYGVMHTSEFTYDGYFLHGEFHGLGSLNVKDHYFYRGNFINGSFQNHGYLLSYKKNIEYEGEFITGQMHGFGRLKRKNIYFEGHFNQNHYHFGLIKDDSGAHPFKFLGSFRQNKPHAGCLWTTINDQKVKIQTTFSTDLVPAQQGLISTQRYKILYDTYQSSEICTVFKFLEILLSRSAQDISIAPSGDFRLQQQRISINVRKTFPNGAFYVGNTVNLVPENTGIFYFGRTDCLVGQFYNGFFQCGRTEFRVGNAVFVQTRLMAKFKRAQIQFLDRPQTTAFLRQRDGTGDELDDKIVGQLSFSLRNGLQRDCAREALPTVINYCAEGIDFQGEVAPRAMRTCKIRAGSALVEAEFSGGVLNGNCVIQKNSIYGFCFFRSGKKEGRAEWRHKNFVYQFDYQNDIIMQMRLVDIQSGEFVIQSLTQRVLALGTSEGCLVVGRVDSGVAVLYKNAAFGYVFKRALEDLRWVSLQKVLINDDEVVLENGDLRSGFWCLQTQDLKCSIAEIE
ncbi:hypothetical protein SS50377_28043 [Spironucleus salmonicida]|uniref:MORN repeat-containing protein n=1 Tax=Spironucleus salmonicida TaxID=348837 RepID=V6LDN7_9EUKA|nr:hypothetical protein SS50377_28043 [Spironucleus salmonicida]|eukprot:EST42597.1 hypothetical protein SS50377_17916 [Spironucleus salmonicida]